MSQVTTHILDTSKGRPAQGVAVVLQAQHGNEWAEIGYGITDADGRVSNLLAKELVLPAGIYKIRFSTNEYFEQNKIKAFYPFVEIVFEISNKEHYHIPLLLNPFGYSTYRGS